MTEHNVEVEVDDDFSPSDEAKGAWPNSTKVIKQNADEGDIHKNGAEGVITGSIAVPPGVEIPEGTFPADIAEKMKKVQFMYFVLWDKSPVKQSVLCLDYKIRKA